MKSNGFKISIGLIMLSLMLVGVVSAAYPMFHHDGQRTGYVPEDGPQNNTILWKANLGEFVGASPVVDGGRVYIGVWPDMNFDSEEEYYLFCLNASTGSEVWRNPLGAGEGTVSGAAVSGDRLFVGCMDGNLYCIDTTDGSTLWNVPVDTGREGGNWHGLSCSPVVYDDMVLVTSMTDGTLHAFDPDGNEVRTYTTGNKTFAYSSPAVDAAGRAYFAGNAVTDALYCIDIDTGEEIWNVTTDGQVKSSPAIAGSMVYAASANRLYALDTVTGIEVWNRSVSASWGTPAVAGGRLYLGTADGVMHCRDAETGDEEWTFTANGRIDTSPVVANDTVYFASNTRTATIFAVDTAGNEVWRYATTNYLQSSPAVSNGILYIGSDEGNLYAFGEGQVPESAFSGWSGMVRLAEGETFTVTPFNNESAVYTVNRTSALGALDAAAITGGFNYTLREETWGSYLYSIAGIVYNETSGDSWLYSVNSVAATVETTDYQLADGDIVTYWYGEWDSTPDTAGTVVNITVSIPATPTPAPGLWSGTVALTRGETFAVTPFNNQSAVYTVNRTSALGALDAAATAGGFNYTLREESWGSYLYSIAGIAYNETSWDSWLYAVNGATAGVGAADYQLADGDVVTYWYGAWDSTPETADHVININVNVCDFAWEGTVNLTDGQTFTVTPLNNASAAYTVNRTSALGALDAAATRGNFNYTLKEESWGSYLYSIGGIAYNETSWDSWLYAVNGVTAGVGAADYQLADGDVVTYWYGAWDSPPESAGAVVNITVSIPTTPTPTPGGEGGGGDSPASWITVTLESGKFNITAANSGKTYTVGRQTALGALDATGTAYTVDDSYYREYGSLFLNSVRGRAGTGTKGWMYQVNGESPAVGANTYALANGDEVVFFWSEGMSSTPATSSDIVPIRVTIPASAGSSESSSSGGGSGSSGSASDTVTEGSNKPGAAIPSFFLGLPAGAFVELGEWGQVFSFYTGSGNTSAEQVTVSGNSFIIKRNGLTMVLTARNINEKEGTATGLIESVTASIEPVTANISSIGLVAASLDLNLTGVPGDGRIEISLNETPDAGAASAFHLAAAENGEEIDALAYTMTVTRTNLENGEDIAGAVIRMTVSPTWVEEHGGVDAVRIARSAEDGRYEVLETRPAGTDRNGNLIFEGISPGGLSAFGLLTVTAAPAAQNIPVSTATAAASGAPTAAGTPAPAGASPLIIAGTGMALLIGAAYLFIERRRRQ